MKYLKKYEVVQTENKLDEVFSKCNAYIEDLKKCDKGSFLSRGVGEYLTGKDYDIEELEHDLFERKPRDMDIDIHHLLNHEFNKHFGWKVRNGLFCFGRKYKDHFSDLDTGYGAKSYLLFPIDDYEIVWNKDINDLYSEFEGESYGEPLEDDANMVYDERYGESGYYGEYYCNDKTTIENDEDEAKEYIVKNYHEFGYEWDEDEYGDENDFKEFVYDDCELEWRPDMEYGEWFEEYTKDEERRIEEDVKILVNDYEEGNFTEAIKSNSEICVKCENYYLIDTEYTEKIIKKIWG